MMNMTALTVIATIMISRVAMRIDMDRTEIVTVDMAIEEVQAHNLPENPGSILHPPERQVLPLTPQQQLVRSLFIFPCILLMFSGCSG